MKECVAKKLLQCPYLDMVWVFGPLVAAVLPQTVIRINRTAHAMDGVEQVWSIVLYAKTNQVWGLVWLESNWESNGTTPNKKPSLSLGHSMAKHNLNKSKKTKETNYPQELKSPFSNLTS